MARREAVIKEDERLLSEMTQKGATILQPDLSSFVKGTLSVYDKAREKYGKEVVDRLVKAADETKQKYPRK